MVIIVIKNSDKEKYMSSGYRIKFDSAGSWSFDNDFAKFFIIFGIDKSSSSHADNRKNNFLILGEGPTSGIDGSFGSPEKNFHINFIRANAKFCLNLHHNAYNSYLNNNVNFSSQLCLRSICNGFSATESREVSLNINTHDFWVDYNSIDKLNILNIHKYLITKNSIK